MRIECNYCRGIKHLEADISLANGGAVIYASNGTFKTSLLDTLAGYSEGQSARDVLHSERTSTFRITDDCGQPLPPDSIHAIKRSSDLTALQFYSDSMLASPGLKRLYIETARDMRDKKSNLINALVAALKGGARSFTTDDVTSFMEGVAPTGKFHDGIRTLISEVDSGFDTSFLDGITYPELFAKQRANIIVKPDVASGIEEYTETLSDMLAKTRYLTDGFTYANLTTLRDLLVKCGFFDAGHEISFRDSQTGALITCRTLSEFNKLVDEEVMRAFDTPEVRAKFDKVAKAFGISKAANDLKALFTNHPSILSELKSPETVRRAFYVRAIAQLRELADEYVASCDSSHESLMSIKKRIKEEQSGWESAMETFNARFSVPFEVSIKNRDDVVVGDAVPVLEFTHEGKVIPQDTLFNCLSTGERNAMFLLYTIFEMDKIEQAASSQTQYVFFDDPVDSFDYKNKYAFVEYVRDFAALHNIKVVILTHNYDFLRALSSRVGDTFRRDDVLLCEQDTNGDLKFQKAEYLAKNVLTQWRRDVSDGVTLSTVAAVSMVRELCEIKNDDPQTFGLLSEVLHGRPSSGTVMLSQLSQAYSDYLGAVPSIADRPFQDICLSECRQIVSSQLPLEPRKLLAGKIVLSMGIRILAERKILPIWSQYNSGNAPSTYGKLLKQVRTLPTSTLEANGIFHQEMCLLEEVALIAPSTIHLNAFMYEPIIDTSEWRFIELFKKCDLL